MKNKKLLFLLILVLIIILIALFFVVKNFNAKNEDVQNITDEYTPEEEISSKQLRETNVNLYFVDSENNIKNESKHIDSAELLQNPYKKLVELLIEGPQSENLNKIFPENTKIIDATISNGCVTLNFSQELQNISDDNQKFNIINCTLNTLTQLNEVSSIKILINDTTSEQFSEEYLLEN